MVRLLRTGICLLVFFLFTITTQAQLAFGYGGNLSSKEGADIDQELKLGTPDQREGLLVFLGVSETLAHDAAAAVSQTGIQVERVEGTEASVLFLPCGGPGSPSSHVYLLKVAEDRHWKIVDAIDLDCWWKPTSFELIQTEGRAGQSLLVHHVTYGHGSEGVEEHVKLFEVKGYHLVKVLETEEYSSENQIGEDRTMELSSTLLPLPDGSLEETRITTIANQKNDKSLGSMEHLYRKHITLAERRHWYWVDADMGYLPSRFAAIRLNARVRAK